jgi:FHS family L-fucose permease-like MFS transporter
MSGSELEAYKLLEASAVKVPYLGIAAILFILAAAVAMFKLPKIDSKSIEEKQINEGSALPLGKSIWAYPHLIFGIIAIFAYVGAEVSIGSFLVNFLGESKIAGLREADAGKFVSFYWGGAMIGRFIGSGLLRKIKTNKLLVFNTFFASLLLLVAIIFSGKIAMWTVLSIGFFNSIMFANIFTMAIDGLGRFTSQGSGILITAIVGGAVIPLFQGILADNIGILYAYFLPLACYLYIMWYGLKGSKPRIRKGFENER